jgi:hypothetical protein
VARYTRRLSGELAQLTFGQGEQEIKLMLASGETILSNQDQF